MLSTVGNREDNLMKMAFATCVQLGRSCIEEVLRIGGSFDLLITLKDEKHARSLVAFILMTSLSGIVFLF